MSIYSDLHAELKKLDDDELDRRFKRAVIVECSIKETPTGLYNAIGKIPARIGELNDHLERSSQASGRLALALNVLTGALVIVGIAGLITQWINT